MESPTLKEEEQKSPVFPEEKCVSCEKVWFRRLYLKNHLERHSEKFGEVPCPQCLAARGYIKEAREEQEKCGHRDQKEVKGEAKEEKPKEETVSDGGDPEEVKAMEIEEEKEATREEKKEEEKMLEEDTGLTPISDDDLED